MYPAGLSFLLLSPHPKHFVSFFLSPGHPLLPLDFPPLWYAFFSFPFQSWVLCRGALLNPGVHSPNITFFQWCFYPDPCSATFPFLRLKPLFSVFDRGLKTCSLFHRLSFSLLLHFFFLLRSLFSVWPWSKTVPLCPPHMSPVILSFLLVHFVPRWRLFSLLVSLPASLRSTFFFWSVPVPHEFWTVTVHPGTGSSPPAFHIPKDILFLIDDRWPPTIIYPTPPHETFKNSFLRFESWTSAPGEKVSWISDSPQSKNCPP